MPRTSRTFLMCAAATAAAVGLIWARFANTEASVMNGIVHAARGTAPRPFVERRLLVDSARLISAAVPAPIWKTLDRALAEGGPASALGARLRSYGWRPEDTPLLLTAHALIGLSAFGFIVVMRSFILINYECSPGFAEAVAVGLGAALLGGYGDRHYGLYPYDIPNVFAFYLTLTLIMRQSPWAPATFVLNCISKETSVLLILGYVLLTRRPLRGRLAVAAGMAAVYVAIRGWIKWAYPPTPDWVYWFPGRNLHVLAIWAAFHTWHWPFFAVAGVRIAMDWRLVPREIRLCWWFVPVMLGMASVKAWFEELRQYLEVMPLLALPAIQWGLREFGLGWRLRARRPGSPRGDFAERRPGHDPRPDAAPGPASALEPAHLA